MSSMDRIRREAMDKYGPAPTTPAEALAHVLAVHEDTPDDRMVLEATNGIYGDRVRTGFTMGDLRALSAALVSSDKPPTDDHAAVYLDQDDWLYADYPTSPPSDGVIRLVWASEEAESRQELADQGVTLRRIGWHK